MQQPRGHPWRRTGAYLPSSARAIAQLTFQRRLVVATPMLLAHILQKYLLVDRNWVFDFRPRLFRLVADVFVVVFRAEIPLVTFVVHVHQFGLLRLYLG